MNLNIADRFVDIPVETNSSDMMSQVMYKDVTAVKSYFQFTLRPTGDFLLCPAMVAGQMQYKPFLRSGETLLLME